MDPLPLFSNFSLSSSSFFLASVLVRQSRLNSFCFPVTLSTGENLAIHRFYFSSKNIYPVADFIGYASFNTISEPDSETDLFSKASKQREMRRHFGDIFE